METKRTQIKRASLSREELNALQQPASTHRTGHYAGFHPEDTPYLSGNQSVNRSTVARATAPRVITEDDDRLYQTRPRSSVRVYNRPQQPVRAYNPPATQVTEDVSPSGISVKGFLIACLFIAFAGVLIAALINLFLLPAFERWNDERIYGYPRILKATANVGHGDRQHPLSQFIAINTNGVIDVVEISYDNAWKKKRTSRRQLRQSFPLKSGQMMALLRGKSSKIHWSRKLPFSSVGYPQTGSLSLLCPLFLARPSSFSSCCRSFSYLQPLPSYQRKNGFPFPQTIDAGTLLIGADGIHLVTDEAASIPGANAPLEGQASVPAHAINAGSQGNIAAYDINSQCCRDNIFVKNLTAFTGGMEARDYSIVTKNDVDTAAMIFKTNAAERIQNSFLSKLQPNEALTSHCVLLKQPQIIV